jgi:DNA-binding MarR family transcriptional regulator
MTSPQEIERAVKTLLAVVQGIRLCEEQTSLRFGLSAAMLSILAALGRKECCSVNELAAELHVHQSSISESAHKLLDRRLIKRLPATDARRVQLTLTARGRSFSRNAGITGRPILEDALSKLPVHVIRESMPHLRAIAEAMLQERALLMGDEESLKMG